MTERLYPMGLLLFSLLFLTIPGILFNNFSSSDLVVPNSPALVCNGATPSQVQLDDTCHGSLAVGCNANFPNLTPCTLKGASISFLNPYSPFTIALEDFTSGDIFGIFTDLTSNGNIAATAHGPFDYSGGGAYFQGSCGIEYTSLTNKWDSILAFSCTQTNPDNSNITRTGHGIFSPTIPQTVTNWNIDAIRKTVSTPFYNWVADLRIQSFQNTTYSMNCIPQSIYNSSASIGYAWYGCDLDQHQSSYPPNGFILPSNTVILSVMMAIPVSNIYHSNVGANTYTHISMYFQPESWDVAYCFLSYGNPSTYVGAYTSPQCQNFIGNLKSQYSSTTNSNLLGLGPLSPIITFFIGIGVFLIGIGMAIAANGDVFGTGGGGSISFNEQGTRLAQTVGLGLIAFSPLYSEFSGWFTSSYLPYGLDGSTGIIGIIILTTFFLSTFWLAISLDD